MPPLFFLDVVVKPIVGRDLNLGIDPAEYLTKGALEAVQMRGGQTACDQLESIHGCCQRPHLADLLKRRLVHPEKLPDLAFDLCIVRGFGQSAENLAVGFVAVAPSAR